MFPTISGRERGGGWVAVGGLLGAVLLAYYALPLVALALSRPPATVVARLDDPAVVRALATSLTGATLSTVVATVFGVPLAYWLARAGEPVRTAVTAVVAFPLVVPPVVAGVVLLLVVGPDTALGRAAASVGVPLTRSLTGVVLAQTFVASPFVVVTARAAFDDVDRRVEEASRTLGRSRAATFGRVTLPLAWPGVFAGVTLAFARALGEFGATLTLAYYPRTMPVQVWAAFSTRGLDGALPAAAVLVGVAVAALLAVTALGRNVA